MRCWVKSAVAISIFVESNIEDLLARGSRVVQIQDAEEGEGISKFSFSKTQFHSSNADAELDMTDPDFWSKVLGQDARETLVQRLKDGTATASESTKEEFLKELFDLAQEVGVDWTWSLIVTCSGMCVWVCLTWMSAFVLDVWTHTAVRFRCLGVPGLGCSALRCCMPGGGVAYSVLTR